MDEWKIHSEIRRKEWTNNIHRVLFPTQICQFWETGLLSLLLLLLSLLWALSLLILLIALAQLTQPVLCFRIMDDEKKAKLGVVECVNHRLIEPFQVLYEKPGTFHSQVEKTGGGETDR